MADSLQAFPKYVALEDLEKTRESSRQAGRSIVLTNGCFDLLHRGHLTYLQQAAELADELWLALNSDLSVQALKGPTRPVQSEMDRAFFLAALSCISKVFIFNTPRLTQEILQIRPDIYVKAGDYTLETINAEERQALQSIGTDIRFLPFVPGYSTTSLIDKINKAADTF